MLSFIVTVFLINYATIVNSQKLPLANMLISGFDGIQSGQLNWFCEPNKWKTEEGKREGHDGSWSLNEKGELVMNPPAYKDFWRLSYYDPPFIKDDAPGLLADINSEEFTIETEFTIFSKSQFDQAGILLRIDNENWIKTGIEFVDDVPRLSCVVTHGQSDWSTTTWHSTTLRIRASFLRDSVAVESFKDDEWHLVRIAPFAKRGNTIKGGVFAACPEDQRGSKMVFHHLTITEGTTFNHNADGIKE